MTSEQLSHESQNWQTMWRIVGPRLPTEEVRLTDRIVLAKFADDDFEYYKNAKPPDLNLTPTTDSFVASYPPRDVVQSRYRLQVDVVSCDKDAAIDCATQITNRLLLSLSLSIEGARFHAELIRIRRADERSEFGAWSQWTRVSPREEPSPLDSQDVQRTLQMLRAIEEDNVATNAYEHLLTAWQLQDTAGAKPLSRSVLQHYVLCMETILNGVMKSVRVAQTDRIRLEERAFAQNFALELAKRSDKPEAIRAASTKLREIGMQNTIPAIGQVVSILQLTEEMEKHAKDMYRFRSSRLSHPGRSRNTDFNKWLHSGPSSSEKCLADLVARAFLTGYCAHLAQRF